MIGTILKNMRKIKGLKQREIGEKLNLARNTISGYEIENISPNFEIINKYAKVCNFEIQFVDKDNNRVYNVKELSKEMDF